MSAPAVVRFDHETVVANGPDGTELTIRWRDVRRIEIVTSADGPWAEDVWWILEGDAARCAWPLGADGADEALAELQVRFPGFDHGAVTAAMSCVEERRFLCWERLPENRLSPPRRSPPRPEPPAAGRAATSGRGAGRRRRAGGA